MPLTFAKIGIVYEIDKVTGKEDVKKFLSDLGFNAGTKINVLNNLHGNLIIKIKDTRVAISKDMAMKIFLK